MAIDLPPKAELWLPPKPAIIRAAANTQRASFPFPVFVPQRTPVSTDTGFTLAGTGANNADAGDFSWSSPGNITADDGSYAAVSDADAGATTQYLHATNFGFAIPAGATIDGIQVRIARLRNGTPNVVDHTVQLIKGGWRSGTNNADTGTVWPTTETNKDYGGASNLWGNTLSPSDLNASNFGIALRATTSGSSKSQVQAGVDAIWIDVYYTF